MHEEFDARRDATSRTYCYRVLARRTRGVFERRRAFWWPREIDRDALAQCAAALCGAHDFTAFTPSETEHSWFRCDVLRAEWLAHGDLLELWIEADMFLRHMNRVLVERCSMSRAARAASPSSRACSKAAPRRVGRTAPAHGLALASVSYE